MKSVDETAQKEMIQLLRDELPEEEARALRQQIERDPSLQEHYRDFERVWEALDLPEAQVPIGWAQRVAASVEGREMADIRWSRAPAWVRTGVAAALLFGLGLGAGLQPSSVTQPTALIVETQEETTPWSMDDEMESQLADPLSLAESYWLMFEEASSADDFFGGESS